MATFVVGIGMTPSEYYDLTLGQRDAIARAAKRMNSK